MAKLNGVKTIDMVNGEITKIAYDGAAYVKVTNPQVGDVCEVTASWGGGDVGEFYTVTEISQSLGKTYTHIDYGTNSYVESFNYYRKTSVSTSPTLEAVAEKVDAIDKRVSALEDVKPAPATKLTHKGADYSLVQRKAQPGDVVHVTKDAVGTSAIPNDAYYLVDKHTKIEGYDVYPEFYNRTESNVLVYAPVAEKLKVGDKVRVLKSGEFGGVDVGEIGGIVRGYTIQGEEYSIRVDGENGDHDYFRPQDLELLDTKALVFAKAGRKVDEYKAGDIVRVTDEKRHSLIVGDVGEITELLNGFYRVTVSGRRDVGNYNLADQIEPVAFVESRVDTP